MTAATPSSKPRSAEEDGMEEDVGVKSAALRHLSGKYITFKLGEEEYGVPILKVQELLRLMKIVRVPKTRDFIRGVINLRGKVIPVTDLRVKFDMGRAEETELSAILVVHCPRDEGELIMGLFVDEVVEVLELTVAQIEARPDFGDDSTELDFLMAMGRHDDRVVFLLDIDKVLTPHELDQVADSISPPRTT